MIHPAVGFGQPLPNSFALTPYDRAASALAWPRGAARPSSRFPAQASPASSPAPAMPGLDAFRDAIGAVVAQFLGQAAPDGTGSAAEGEGSAGPPPSRGGPMPRAEWRQPERNGRPGGGTFGGGMPDGQRGTVGTIANRAPTVTGAPAGGAVGGLSGQSYSDAKRQAYRDYDPIGFGPVGEYVASGVALAHPVLGLLNAGRHIYNTEETAAYQAKFGEPMGFWDRFLGWFGLTDASGGSLSAAGRTLEKAPSGSASTGGSKRNPDGSSKTSTPGYSGSVTGYKPGYAPGEPLHGTTGLGESRSAGRSTAAPVDDRVGPGTGGLY